MKVNVITPVKMEEMEPLTCRRDFLDIPVAGMTLQEAIKQRCRKVLAEHGHQKVLSLHGSLFPSLQLLEAFADAPLDTVIISADGEILAWLSEDGEIPEGGQKIVLDHESVLIKYPWDILAVNETLVGEISHNMIEGVVRENVVIDGNITVGKGTVLLPGVYIEGNAVIGENCKIGPNCYIRGNTAIGDNCHIGQAVEVKNSILMNNIGAGHLSYVGDSILCDDTNLGAGTITANFRHDGKSHRSMIDNKLIDTGRRKLGCIIGDNVHTGIHTSFYPGRKVWPDLSTLPGEVVSKDIKS